MRFLIALFIMCCLVPFSTFAKSAKASTRTAENTRIKGIEANTTTSNLTPNQHPIIYPKNAMNPNEIAFASVQPVFGYPDNESVFSYKSFTSESTGSVNSSIIFPGIVFSQGLFYGFTIMLILLNFTCFFLFNEKSFIYFSIALLGLSSLLFYKDGLVNLLSVNYFEIDLTIQLTLLFIFVLGANFFSSKFLNSKDFFPKVNNVALALIGIAGIAIVFEAFTKNIAFAQIATITLFTSLATYFIAGIALFSKKNYAKFYVIGSFIPLLFGIDYFVLAPMGIEFLGTEMSHIKTALITQMLILTYGIMYRMQAIKEENELRQIEMRIFLKRQEVLTARQKTEKLVEDVYLENLIMHYDLDGMEIKLLQYISEGKENTKIARKLKITVAEVEEYTKELYQKLEIGEQIQQDYRMVEQQPDYIYN